MHDDSMIFEGIHFTFPFRDYQQRVLDTLREKLEDNKVHIVAAPGSGKTVLGLEIIRRIGKPCLILVPSINIREQWIDKFMDLFVPSERKEEWESKLSIDIFSPGIITCITYQALYSALNDKDVSKVKAAIGALKKAGYGTLCLDESHHLKKEWWRAMDTIVNALAGATIVALTATPPYDSDGVEWSRYNALCGEIDCEVLTPEMVKKHTLVPYQDFVYLSVPTDEEQRLLEKYLDKMQNAGRELLMGQTLYELLKTYDALVEPNKRAELYITEPRLLEAFVSYIRMYGIESSIFYEKNSRKPLKWDGELINLAKKPGFQGLEGELLEIFLDTIVNKDAEAFDPVLLEQFRDECRAKRILINNKIKIVNMQEEIEKLTRNSLSKFQSIKTIIRTEATAQGEELRMVILADYVGKENLQHIETEEKLHKLDCVSIFETCRRMEHLNNLDAHMKSYIDYCKELGGTNIGLLCGTMAILPEKVRDKFGDRGRRLGNTNYFLIDISDTDRRDMVSRITGLLEEGQIRILIGTVSLLGEGWDAPCVNTVVIASTVSSFVQSNQIRGRGLRLDGARENKVANIWHLATLEPLSKRECYKGGGEYNILVRRFDSILGISRSGDRISSGIERIGFPAKQNSLVWTGSEVDSLNRSTLEYASNRELIRLQWNSLMDTGSDLSQIREVSVMTCASILRWNKRTDYLSMKELRTLANGLYKDMSRRGLIPKESAVHCSPNPHSMKTGVYLDNCQPSHSRLFNKYYEQIALAPVTPRYLLLKGWGPWKRYLAVPDYCRNMSDAERFKEMLGYHKGSVIYTRNTEGIRLLFELRVKNLKLDVATADRVREIVIK